MALDCPTCDADVKFVVGDRCLECGDEELVEIIERLRPQ